MLSQTFYATFAPAKTPDDILMQIDRTTQDVMRNAAEGRLVAHHVPRDVGESRNERRNGALRVDERFVDILHATITHRHDRNLGDPISGAGPPARGLHVHHRKGQRGQERFIYEGLRSCGAGLQEVGRSFHQERGSGSRENAGGYVEFQLRAGHGIDGHLRDRPAPPDTSCTVARRHRAQAPRPRR